MLFSALWFISVMAINLQMGTHTLSVHVIVSVLMFMVCYICLVIFMNYGYQDIHQLNPSLFVVFSKEVAVNPHNCTTLPVNFITSTYYGVTEQDDCRCSLNEISKLVSNVTKPVYECYERRILTINIAEEGTFIFSCLLLGIALFMLQRFIREYAFSLIDRQKHVAQLTKVNADLKSQLKALKKEVDLDLESPITKVIKILRNIQVRREMDPELVESLDYVVQILSSNQLDVNKWLNAMITNQTDGSMANQKDLNVMSITDLDQ
ncbi:hypothetical protein HK102_006555, partial [Quaeritorhiza haematococci]